MPNWNLRAGDRVRLRRLPADFVDLPGDDQDILDLCLGREFEVKGLSTSGKAELDVSRISRREPGPARATIFVDSDCVELLDRYDEPRSIPRSSAGTRQ